MASTAFLKVRRGVASVRTVVGVSATVVISELLNRSAFNLVLNSGRGRWRRSAAMLTSGASRSSTCDVVPLEPASRRSTAWSNCSDRLSLRISATYVVLQLLARCFSLPRGQPRFQRRNRPKLELFDSTFAATEFRRNLANAVLLCESHAQNLLLIVR